MTLEIAGSRRSLSDPEPKNGERARAKVGKSVCERTFAGARGNDEDAPKIGAHAFRRFRNTHLRNFTSCPEGILKFWMGDGEKTMSEHYEASKRTYRFERMSRRERVSGSMFRLN